MPDNRVGDDTDQRGDPEQHTDDGACGGLLTDATGQDRLHRGENCRADADGRDDGDRSPGPSTR